jgi:hypothetical protein
MCSLCPRALFRNATRQLPTVHPHRYDQACTYWRQHHGSGKICEAHFVVNACL